MSVFTNIWTITFIISSIGLIVSLVAIILIWYSGKESNRIYVIMAMMVVMLGALINSLSHM